MVLNGGVSLAVWMGGAVLELDQLTHKHGAYGDLLRILRCTARADVITGTSAGGINGAALALSQVNENARLSGLRDLWVEQGRFEELLRKPFHGQPASLLQGDEFFLPRLKTAFEQLTREFTPRPADQRPIDLRITTTLRTEHPAAVTAGWAAVYSLVLLAAALSLGQWSLPESLDQRQWTTDSAVAVTLVYGFVLSLITTWFVPWRARRKLRGTAS